MLRVHDVAPMREALTVVSALLGEREAKAAEE
jgi:dihydropteroate synthase